MKGIWVLAVVDEFNFSRFKQDINLSQYAACSGYKIDRKKSTRNSVAMRKDNSDKVIISRKNGYWVYFSVFDDRDKGSIVDFIKNRTDKSLFEIGHELQMWLGGNIALSEAKNYARNVEEKKADPERIKRLFNYCSPATNHHYLESRGITEDVLRSGRFEGRIFQDRYKNAVFPHFNNGLVCGLELKSGNTGLLVRGSEKTLWRSNMRKSDDTLVIAEAPIDAISYQILHQLSAAFYVATSGGFSQKQSNLIRALVTSPTVIKKTILITDNDKGGDELAHRFNALINDTDYQGLITRHSPELPGQDWNDVLKMFLRI